MLPIGTRKHDRCKAPGLPRASRRRSIKPAGPSMSETAINSDRPAFCEETGSPKFKRAEWRGRDLREPTPGSANLVPRRNSPKGAASRLSQNGLSDRDRSPKSPGASEAIRQNPRGDTSILSANRIARLPHHEPLPTSSSRMAQINSVVPVLGKSVPQGNPKILGSISNLQP